MKTKQQLLIDYKNQLVNDVVKEGEMTDEQFNEFKHHLAMARLVTFHKVIDIINLPNTPDK